MWASIRKRERRKEKNVIGAMTSCGVLAGVGRFKVWGYILARVRILYIPAVAVVMRSAAVLWEVMTETMAL